MSKRVDASKQSKLREIEKRLQVGQRLRGGNFPEVPLALQTLSLVSYAQEYLRAAKRLDVTDVPLELPRLQVTGQAIELALKACLASADVRPPKKHDLLRLYESAESAGFALDQHLHLACLVHANHWFASDLATGTRYKSRYPPPSAEGIGGSVPAHETFAEMVNLLCEQARLRLPHLWPPEYSFLRGSTDAREHVDKGRESERPA